MASFNKVLLMGNLTRKPELRYTPSGMAVCEFTIAVNRRFTQGGETKEDTCFVDITVWDRQADNCNKYLDKGSSVFIEGRLQLDRWVDKADQKQRSRLRVVAENVQFVGARREGGDYGDGGGAHAGSRIRSIRRMRCRSSMGVRVSSTVRRRREGFLRRCRGNRLMTGRSSRTVVRFLRPR